MGETTAVDVDDLEPGDEVLWDDRKEPLEVQESNVRARYVSGSPNSEQELPVRKVKGDRGGIYVLVETDFGDPEVKRRVSISSDHPNGLAPHGRADNLRRVVEEGSEEEGGGIGEYTVEIAVTGTWRETVVAHAEGEAEDVAEQHLEEHLNLEEGEWGDIGFEVVGAREVGSDE